MFKKCLYFLKRKLHLYFWKWNLAHFTLSLENKRNPPEENFLYFKKRKKKRKKFLAFSQKKAVFMFWERETAKKVTCKGWKSKIFYTCHYKEVNFSKLKYFFIIIIKGFFSFYNIFFYTQQAFLYHPQRGFSNALDHIVAFFCFFRKILMSLARLLCSLSLFSW